MKDALVIIGVFFLIFSVFVFEAWRKKGADEGKDAAQGAFFALWVLIAFGLGSWAISFFFGSIFDCGDWIAKKLNINPIWIILSPIIGVAILGYFNRAQDGKK